MINRSFQLTCSIALMFLSAQAFAAQCSTYQESPFLKSRMASGDLPPVADRLPENPLVVDGVDGVGKYGGNLIDIYGGSRVGEYRHYGYDPLVRWSPDGSKILPSIAESWEISPDATTYTFKLRRGMKWSDGVPFTANDIVFWWKNVETNREINGNGPRNIFIVDGEEATVKALDDYTIQFSWSSPNGVFLMDLSTPYGQRIVQFAEHYVKDFMKELNPNGVSKMMAEAGETDFGKWWIGRIGTYGHNSEHNDPNRPTLLAWKTVSSWSGKERFTFERNPYYWKVDSDCNQLPYIDERTWILAKDAEVKLLKVIQGEVDISPREISTPPNRAVFYDNQERGKYHLTPAATCNYNTALFMFSMNHPDPVKAQVFQNKDFRIGLSLGMDREAVIEAVYLGQGEPFQVAPRPDSPYYHERLAKQYTKYDPAKAAEHLDKILPMGPDGKRLGPDGKPFKFIIQINTGFGPEWVDVAQIIEQTWRELGLEPVFEYAEDEVSQARREDPNRETFVWIGENGCGLFPLVNMVNMVNKYANWEAWEAWDSLRKNPDYKVPEGVTPQEPPATLARMYELMALVPQKIGDEQTKLVKEFFDLSAEGFYIMGVSLPSGGYRSVSNRLHNIPPSFLEGWLYPGPAPVNFSTFWLDS